jgi:hypothetical protein
MEVNRLTPRKPFSACLPVGRDIRILEYQAEKEVLVWSPDFLVPCTSVRVRFRPDTLVT